MTRSDILIDQTLIALIIMLMGAPVAVLLRLCGL
jgi:hypothetical protein